jgi:membrane protease YdiL (CAAX protease family)
VLVLTWVADGLLQGVAVGLVRASPLARLYPDEAGPTARTWLVLWAVVLSLPVRLLAAGFLVRAVGDARLAALGVTASGAARGVGLAAAVALPVVLAVYAVNLGCETVMRQVSGGEVQEHVFAELARQGPTTAEWLVLIASAVLAAPLWEEFLFRGLVQPWALSRSWAGSVLMGLAVVLAVALRYDEVRTAWVEGTRPALVALLPALTALAMVPVYLILRAACRSPVPAAVFAVAVLFGWLHARFWPSPVPLTLLGIALGWLAYRTRSLVGPVVLHAAFNGVAVVMLLLGVDPKV